MISGGDLSRALDRASVPDSGFNVVSLTQARPYKVGWNSQSGVVLLTPPDASPGPPTRLKRLSLDPRLHCRIEEFGRGVTEADVGIVQLTLDDGRLLEPFLDVAAAFIRVLGPNPGPGQVSASMRRLVRLFEGTDAPRGTALGLWAELLIIATSSDVSRLVSAWHSHVDDRFDFAEPADRLEVKATTKGTRLHSFSLQQLGKVEGATTSFASIMTTQTQAGTSISDLVHQIEEHLAGDAAAQLRVHEVVAQTLGPNWSLERDASFDEVEAAATLQVYSLDDMPRVQLPPEVVEARLTIDCSEILGASELTGLACLLPAS